MTTRLLGVVISEWSRFNGFHLSRGVNVLKMHPQDLLDVVWAWLIENLDSKEIDKLGRQIWLPPPGEEPTDDNPYFGYEAEMKAFEESQKMQANFGR